METVSFIATSAEEAVAQIRERLGPTAVVVDVRRLPPNGLARLWQKPMMEVLAGIPADAEPAAPLVDEDPFSEALADFRQQLAEIKEHVASRPVAEVAGEPISFDDAAINGGQWRVGPLLRKSGLLPLHTQHILDKLQAQYGEVPPESLGEQIHCAQEVLTDSWQRPPAIEPRSLHVLVGPAGCGKTTYLSKWLTQTVLVEGRLAHVWRLDGATANAAESLSVYCDVLGVAHDRIWQGGSLQEDIGFIDLPGVDWRKPAAIRELSEKIKQFGPAQVHLVLNGAYDISVLLAQYRAFSGLPVDDIAITHLDEEPAWGKIWNLALGTNCSIRHLSAGQNIPGDLWPGTAELIFARQFPGKPAGNGFAKQLQGLS